MDIETFSFIGQSAVAVVINLLFFMLFKNMYGTRYSRKWIYIVSYIVAVLSMVGVSQLKIQYVNAIYSFISINLICTLLFEPRLEKTWLRSLLIWFIFICCDAVSVLIWSASNGNTLEGTLSNDQLMLASNIINIIFLVTAHRVYLILNNKLKYQAIQLKIVLFMVTMTFFEVWIVVTYASQISDRSGGIQVIIFLLGFLLINIFLAYILNRVSKAYQYENELDLIKQLQKIQFENYKETERKYRESRAIIHDIKKHLDVLQQLQESDVVKAMEYREHINMQMDKIFCGFHCSNRIMGIILSQKISRAKSEGIKVDVSVDEVNIDFIDDLDITAILANLWDNAIESCIKAESGKYIKFSLSRYRGFILFDLENNFDGVCEKSGNKFKSTKKYHTGVGLSSITASVNKYNGLFSANVEGNIFKAEITIPIPTVT